ncbi:unnamed protein product [Schistosoma margrebowiei]|uniref:Uncharacterized protein n=1 Tax=Schistosoma margrebowiei TaxID=48269 RepID=A0A3P8CTR2_9TREM|nr:unnamed protein product [Schistosoma margrebowiei]
MKHTAHSSFSFAIEYVAKLHHRELDTKVLWYKNTLHMHAA